HGSASKPGQPRRATEASTRRGQASPFALASQYPMSLAAVQKHVAVLERAGLITKRRIGRRRVVRTNLEALLVARRLLDQYEDLWRARIDRMNELIAGTAGAMDTVETRGSNR